MEKTKKVLVPTLGLIFSDMFSASDEFEVTIQLPGSNGSFKKLRAVKGDNGGIKFITIPSDKLEKPVEQNLMVKQIQKGKYIVLNGCSSKVVAIDRVRNI